MNSTLTATPARYARRFFKSRTAPALLGLALLALCIWQIALVTEKKSLANIGRAGELRVNYYAASLRDTLEKYRPLPYVLARDPRIVALLDNEIPALRVNPHLEDFAHASGALIYALDRGGTTVASSNWREERSLLGHNYSFRPYFTDARDGKAGGYYAVGLRTVQPGFFLSYPVMRNGEFLGAVVVKVNLEPLQEAWKKSDETIIVSDAFGVIFLTSKTEWKYKSLRELPRPTAHRLQALQYYDLPLPALNMRRQIRMDHNILILDNASYHEQALQLPEYGWRIHYLTDLKVVADDVQLAVVLTTVFASLLFLIFLYMRERRQKLLSRQEAREAIAVREVNERLRREIAEHRQTAIDLRKTQKELVQAGKLAALGRMSAAIAHELNQPVTAIRTFTASCRILLERQEKDKVNENLDFIAGLTDRMAKITGQLKTFARKSKGEEKVIDLIPIVDRVLRCMQPQIEKTGATVSREITEDHQAWVAGDNLQIEQVLSNLLHNGLDAVRDTTQKDIEISVHTGDGRVRVSVADSGAGIAEEAVDSLFDPFFTTKDIGEGLGLGLSISYGIIQEMNGSIRAENRGQGGARFIIDLPLIENKESHDDDTGKRIYRR